MIKEILNTKKERLKEIHNEFEEMVVKYIN
jgi:hypothetical protein